MNGTFSADIQYSPEPTTLWRAGEESLPVTIMFVHIIDTVRCCFVFMCIAQLPRRASAYDVYQNRVDPGSSSASRRSSFRVQQDDDIGSLQQQKGERAILSPPLRLTGRVRSRVTGQEVGPVLRSWSYGIPTDDHVRGNDARYGHPHSSADVRLNGWKNAGRVSPIVFRIEMSPAKYSIQLNNVTPVQISTF